MIDFDKKIVITNWKTKEAISVVLVPGLLIIARSTRWEGQHCTSEVRRLYDVDAARLDIELGTPVTFSQ